MSIIEKFKNKPLKEAELEYEGVKFRLREPRDASKLAEVMTQIDMLPPATVFKGQKIPRKLLEAVKWIKLCLVEPEMTEEELFELANYVGGFIYRLSAKAMELCGVLNWEELLDFFVKLTLGSGGEELLPSALTNSTATPLNSETFPSPPSGKLSQLQSSKRKRKEK
jgi:hypothetical protein